MECEPKADIQIAQVETKLVSEVEAYKSQKSQNIPFTTNIDEIQDIDLDISNDAMDSGFGNEQFDFTPIPSPPSIPVGNPMSQELISMGLDEPLPPQHIIDELYVLACCSITEAWKKPSTRVLAGFCPLNA